MAEKARRTSGTRNGLDAHDDARDNSFEAADAVPGVMDDIEYEDNARAPIDLDAPVADTKPRPGAAAEDAAPAEDDADTGVSAEDDASAEDAVNAEDDAPTAAVSSKELNALKAQATEANDKYMRVLAEMQNYRRRTEEEKGRIIRDANERLIKELLPVLDDFDLALEAARKTESYEQLVGGITAVERKFQDTLGKQGVVSIPALGEKFNAEVHEAVMLDEDSDEEDETVTAQLRKGYTLNGRVIRASLVKVAKQG